MTNNTTTDDNKVLLTCRKISDKEFDFKIEDLNYNLIEKRTYIDNPESKEKMLGFVMRFIEDHNIDIHMENENERYEFVFALTVACYRLHETKETRFVFSKLKSVNSESTSSIKQEGERCDC